MSDLHVRWDAEDIAEGTPLSGPDRLVERIIGGLYGARDAGYEQGYSEGYYEGIEDVETILEPEGPTPKREDFKYDGQHRDALVKWLEAALERKIEEAKREGFNDGVEAMADELGTKRADKLAGELFKLPPE